MKNLLTSTLFVSLLLLAAMPSMMEADLKGTSVGNFANAKPTQVSLRKAIKNDKIEEVKKILESNSIDVHEKTPSDGAVLAEAALMGNKAIIDLLIKHGFDPNTRCSDRDISGYGFTVLMLAVNYGNPETVEPLIRAGAKVNAQALDYRNCTTALMCAVDRTAMTYTTFSERDLETMRTLLKNGADPYIKNGSGWNVFDSIRWYDSFTKHGGVRGYDRHESFVKMWRLIGKAANVLEKRYERYRYI